MKRLGRVLGSLLAVALTVFSMQVFAAAQTGGRDFNHMTTGFILSGAHAVAACETCHIGGVFKGTPRTCDGCHATGKRIIATPKSNNHVVTDAQCDSCHFNTATWLGARYNHGTAVQGQCTNCHNGRIAAGKHAAHIATTQSCDACHRTSAFIPASWNHTGAQYVGQDCGTSCHNGTTARTFTNTAYHTKYQSLGITSCSACHTNYSSFYSHRYDHAGVTATCVTCHTAANSPAIRAMAANHIPISVSASCVACHSSTASWATVTMQHTVQIATTPCITCHLSTSPYLGRMDKKKYGHEGFRVGEDCISCHAQQYSRWNKP